MPVPDKQGCRAPHPQQLTHPPSNRTETFLSTERGDGWLTHPVRVLGGPGIKQLLHMDDSEAPQEKCINSVTDRRTSICYVTPLGLRFQGGDHFGPAPPQSSHISRDLTNNHQTFLFRFH